MVRRHPDKLPPNLPPRGLSREESAQYLGLSPSLFDDLIKQGAMPEAIKAGGRVVWDRFALDRAFEALPTRQPQTERMAQIRKGLQNAKW